MQGFLDCLVDTVVGGVQESLQAGIARSARNDALADMAAMNSFNQTMASIARDEARHQQDVNNVTGRW